MCVEPQTSTLSPKDEGGTGLSKGGRSQALLYRGRGKRKRERGGGGGGCNKSLPSMQFHPVRRPVVFAPPPVDSCRPEFKSDFSNNFCLFFLDLFSWNFCLRRLERVTTGALFLFR